MLNSHSYEHNYGDAHHGMEGVHSTQISKASQKRAAAGFGSGPVTSTENLVLNELPRKLFDVIRPFLRRTYVSKEQFLFQQDDELEYVYFPETAVISVDTDGTGGRADSLVGGSGGLVVSLPCGPFTATA